MHIHKISNPILSYINVKENFYFKTCYKDKYSFLNKKNTSLLTLSNKLSKHGCRLSSFKFFKKYFYKELIFLNNFLTMYDRRKELSEDFLASSYGLRRAPSFLRKKFDLVLDLFYFFENKKFLCNLDLFLFWKFYGLNPMFASRLSKQPNSSTKQKKLKIVYVTKYRRLLVTIDLVVNFLRFNKKKNYKSTSFFKPLTNLFVSNLDETILEDLKLKVYSSYISKTS